MSWQNDDIFLARLSSPFCEFIIPPTNLSWYRLLANARKEKTACIVYRSIKRENYVVHESVTTQFEEILNNTQSKNILIANQLSQILKEFDRASLNVIPLKGTFMAKFIYQDLRLRPMGDIDILIDKSDFDKTFAILADNGYSSKQKPPEAGSNYLNSVNFCNSAELYSAPIHLHWNIINASLPLFMYKVDTQAIWRDSRKIDYDGVKANAMAPHHLLLHLAEHALKHSFDCLINLVDIAWLINFFSSPATNEYKDVFKYLDWDSVIKYARAWNFESPLYLSLRLANELLATPLPKDVAKKTANCLRGFETRRLLKYVMQNNRWQGLSVLGYLGMLNFSGKVRFALSSLFPPAEDLKSFGKEAKAENYIRRTNKAFKILCERLF